VTLVVFRSRLRPEVADAYALEAAEIGALAKTQPGILSFKTFTAPDGERVTLAEFDSDESVALWRENARHQKAQQRGKTEFYSEYSVQVCEVLRESSSISVEAISLEALVPRFRPSSPSERGILTPLPARNERHGKRGEAK
jgi:heme-degrading monooxygenase HmoA